MISSWGSCPPLGSVASRSWMDRPTCPRYLVLVQVQVQVEAVWLQRRSQRLLVAGRRVGEGSVEVEDHGLDAGGDRGHAASRWSWVRADRGAGRLVHAGAESARLPQHMHRAPGPCHGSRKQPRSVPALWIHARISSAASCSPTLRRSTTR